MSKDYVFDIKIEFALRNYQEGDHTLVVFGVDSIALGVISLADFSKELLNLFPIGVGVVGFIHVYNDNLYEDFEEASTEVLKKFRENFGDSLFTSKSGATTHLIKEVMHVSVFEFEENKLISLEDQSDLKDINVLFKQASTIIKDNFGLGYASIAVVPKSDDTQILLFQSEKEVDLPQIDLFISLLNTKTQAELFLEGLGSKDESEEGHILSLIGKINSSQKSEDYFNSFKNQLLIQDLGFKKENSNYVSYKKVGVAHPSIIKEHIFGDFFFFSITESTKLLATISGCAGRLIAKVETELKKLFSNEVYELNESRLSYNEILFPSPLILSKKQIQADSKKIHYNYSNLSTKFDENLGYPNDSSLRQKSNKLFNVHSALNNSGFAPSSKFYGVKGIYEYYHYKQDNINDRGWGCAYRSFQCLYSWFFHNNIFNKSQYPPTPSILEMQKVLVDAKDKEASIIGSNKWIGAFEGCIILSELLKIDSQIIYVGSGSEMKTKAREIAHHFEVVGSPIMIGGGVYAYTILGIHYDITNGDCSYLILDPHYEDKDEIGLIVKNGGVSWKTGSLFEKGSFYNLCLPKIPTDKK